MISSKLMTLSELLNYRFIIPPFQRAYEWDDKKDSLKRITNFITTIINDVTGQTQTNQCFLGNIVLCATEKQQCYKVIDGAQRINTLLLLLCSIHTLSKDSNTLLTIKNKLYNLYHQSGQPELLLPIDNTEFSWLNQLPDYTASKNPKLIDASNIITALLKSKLTGNAIDFFFNRIMTIVQFNVLDEADAAKENESHHLFEVINSGLPLSEVDILRGKLFEHKINNLTKFKTLFLSQKYSLIRNRNKLFKAALSCSKHYGMLNHSTKTVTLLGADRQIKDFFLSSEFSTALSKNPDFVTHLQNIESKLTTFMTTFSPKVKYNGANISAPLALLDLAITIPLNKLELVEKENIYNIYCLLSAIAKVGTTSPMNSIYPTSIYELLNATTAVDTLSALKTAIRSFVKTPQIKVALTNNLSHLSYLNSPKEITQIFSLIEEFLIDSDPSKQKSSKPLIDSNTQLDHIYPKSSNIGNVHSIGNLTLLEGKLNSTKSASMTGITTIYNQSSFALTTNCLAYNNIPTAYNGFNVYCKTKLKSFDIITNPVLIPDRTEFIKDLFLEAVDFYLA